MEMNKPKKSLMRLVFGRTGIILLLIILQAAVLVSSMMWLGDVFSYIMGGFTIVSTLIVVYIINRNDNPAYKLAWMPIVIVFPVLGGLFYLYVRSNIATILAKVKMWDIQLKTRPVIEKDNEFEKKLKTEKGHLYRMGKYIESVTGLRVYSGSKVKYFSLGEHKFKCLLEELEKAEKFIFIEYFIVEEGLMWNSILEILEKKVQQGVEVRVMYDGIGTLMTLPHGYDKKLRDKGIKTKIFMPVTPMLSTIQNNRDHRKIVVIDGKCAFNGGVNLADEYINKKVVYGHWKDTAVMVTGEAVKSYTMMFLQMWNTTEKQPEDYRKYINASEPVEGEGYVYAFGDNPLITDRVGKTVYCDMLNGARDYVHIMSPYFLPDDEILEAMCTAAKSGVDVKMIIPHIPDKKIPFIMARSYYNRLLDAGVKVYEYKPGFVHAKTFVSDNKRAVVGTINLDYRSLYLHFECATCFEDCDAVDDVEKDFNETLEKCIMVSHKYYKELPFWERTLGRFLRIFAPLM